MAAIRARYSNPNFYVGVSGKLINRLGGQNVTMSDPLRENVGGRLVRGNIRTDVRVRVELVDDPNQVQANVRLDGSLESSAYIQQGKVQVFTGASGQLGAVRSVFANIGGLFGSDPQVAANVTANFAGTSSRLKLVNKIAAKKFAEARSKSEAFAAQTAEEQLTDQFGTQTDTALVAGKEGLQKAQVALAANSLLVPQIYLRSTNTQVVVVGKKSSIGTLGAPDYPIALTVPTDVSIRVHETLLSNFLDDNFRGKTFTDKQLAEEIGQLTGGETPAFAPPAGEEGEEDEDNSFSITFDNVRPIQFEFDNNGLGVSIAGRRFSQGERRTNTRLRIGLRFKIMRKDGKLKLVRDGKATVDYIDDKKDARAVFFRSFLEGRLNPKEGGQQIEVDLPDNLIPIEEVEALQESEVAKQMRLVQVRSENGWLYLGWNHQPENTYFAWQMDIPAIWTEATVYEMGPQYIDGSGKDGTIEIPVNNPVSVLQNQQINSQEIDLEMQSFPPPLPAGSVVTEMPVRNAAAVPSKLSLEGTFESISNKE